MEYHETREAVVLENNGQKIFGILHTPKGITRPPCVLVCHGLGGHKTGRYRVYVDLAEALVAAGIAVFRFDFRGSGDSEGSFGDMTLTGEVSDALVALKYLQGEKKIDNHRIGVFGRSLGGAVAVISSAKFGAAKSLALWSPIFDGEQWKHLWEKTQDGITSEHELLEYRRINGQVAGLPFYAELFGMNIKDELKSLEKIPLLLIHGLKDDMVYSTHSEAYMKEREGLKTSTKLIFMPHGDHDFTYSPERADAIDHTAAWFKQTLSG